MDAIALKLPTATLVEEYVDRFEKSDRYRLGDQAIIKLISLIPENTDLSSVFLKVWTINSLYSAGVYHPVEVAQRILDLEFDTRVSNHDVTLVGDVATIPRSKGKPYYLVSFASKYCSWHNLSCYPLYDSNACYTLKAYRDKLQFMHFTNEDLANYVTYKLVIEAFQNQFGLKQVSFKRLDKFLWIYGKELQGKL